ncbi:DUF4115 domain-containing protein [Paenibacillus filicis]|uniref:DUF4115 domain-containing protein n=1 Tax=Paenibacillus gyeongsangnamensis TaxID=3388067 RepID=A0ABT4Q5Z4_9BACL|nr:helix-turn-helix domain-containing protein [Paenibacillus filicis]MCZ8512299.1 DUF4115 domain-containing protein [Paenibacillus filicis]
MSDLGQLLRKARLEKKISLEELQDTTKIRKWYLEAIEEGNYKVLPGNFYVRAFIKSYSEAVGLDPNEVLRLYQNVIPAPEPEHIEPMRTKRTTGRNTEKIGKWASSIMMISFIVLILGIIYYYLNLNHKGATNDAKSDLPKTVTDKVQPVQQTPPAGGGTAAGSATYAKPDPIPAPPPVPPPAPATDVKLAKSERGIDYYTITGTDKMRIELSITGDACWIELDSLGDNQKTLDSKTYENGTTKSWDLTGPAFMIFGKASAAQLKVNGVQVPLGDAPNVKKIQVDFQKT